MEKTQSCATGAHILPRIEYVSEGETLYDFCLWEYKPLASCRKKFSAATLLFNSFEAANANKKTYDLVHLIREGIGPSRTVWGTKLLGGDIKWEFYFYDYARKARKRSATKILDVIRPIINCPTLVNENLEYFMFSLDITEEYVSGVRELDEVHLYVGNPGSTVSSGICYSLIGEGTRLENFYFFFDAQREVNEIIAKARSSAYIDSQIHLDEILWPEMRNCKVIVIANKQQNDSVYFSGVDVNQLLFFLKRLNYPREIVDFVESNKASLDHLQYDVGFDYRMANGRLSILKSGYYGVF
ncbi:MAG: hypothetical protein JW902_04265 [Syntrophaceae bacterium]|nr:hypothetical protein [Syntrophaceae bacterium]